MINDKVFLATNWDGLVRAETNSQGDWAVDRVIEGQRINCRLTWAASTVR